MALQTQQLFLFGLALSTLFLGYKQYFQQPHSTAFTHAALAPVLSPEAMSQLHTYSLPALPYAYNVRLACLSCPVI
jgi:hypothetical protein